MTTTTADDGHELSPEDRATNGPHGVPGQQLASVERTYGRLRRVDRARIRLCQRASGDVLEIGIGEGRSIEHYAEDVRLTGIDADDAMIDAARAQAQRLGRDVNLVECDAHVLPFPADSFDSVVGFRVLCAVADDAIVLGEAWRVLRGGGSLLLTDHVASSWLIVRTVQRAMDRLIAPSTGEFHARRPIVHVRSLGFEVVESERGRFGLTEIVHARKPAAADHSFDRNRRSGERMRLKSEPATTASDAMPDRS